MTATSLHCHGGTWLAVARCGRGRWRAADGLAGRAWAERAGGLVGWLPAHARVKGFPIFLTLFTI
jgi:hypothetical protein